MTCPLPRDVLEEALGVRQFSLREVRGGYSKQVYEALCGEDRRMLYLWQRPYAGALTDNRTEGADYLFSSGVACFLYNSKLLAETGVRTPRVYASGHWERGGVSYAVVERLPGVSLEQYRSEGGDLAAVGCKITELLQRLSACRRAFYGPPLETRPYPLPPEQLALRFYLEELRIASALDPGARRLRPRLEARLRRLAQKAGLEPLADYGLIHGELTPPHVFLLQNGELALIDLEGATFFDAAFEWAAVSLHYGGAVPTPSSVDRNRLALYRLCLRIGYLSCAVDFLAHVDAQSDFFQGLRDGTLRALQTAKDNPVQSSEQVKGGATT